MDQNRDTNRRWLLEHRPRGDIEDSDFRWDEQPVSEPSEGEIVVRMLMLSCDPTQRGWLGGDTYLPAIEIGAPVRSIGAGRVVASRHADYAEGDIVTGILSWQDYVRLAPTGLNRLAKLSPDLPLERALSVLGLNGNTAYFGLLDIGRPQPGETLVVSGAAGATGSLVGQIGKIKGCRVIGIAGGHEKCRWLTQTAGFDVAIDYKSDDVAARLHEACPDGIDIYFDNVGGEILDVALAQLAFHGRVVLCGAIANYNATQLPPGPKNYLRLLVQRGRMEGFIVLDYAQRYGESTAALAAWLAEGKLTEKVDVQQGLENAPATLRRLFSGHNEGKQLLRIA